MGGDPFREVFAKDEMLGLLSFFHLSLLNTLLSPEQKNSCNAPRSEENSLIFPLSLGGSAGALLAGGMQVSNFLQIPGEGEGTLVTKSFGLGWVISDEDRPAHVSYLLTNIFTLTLSLFAMSGLHRLPSQ